MKRFFKYLGLGIIWWIGLTVLIYLILSVFFGFSKAFDYVFAGYLTVIFLLSHLIP